MNTLHRAKVFELYIPLFLICTVSLIAYASILRSPLYFMDDALRIAINEGVNQGVHGRPFADVIFTFFSDGLFIDISPFSQIIAVFFLIASGVFYVGSMTIYIEKNSNYQSTIYSFAREHFRSINNPLLVLLFVCFPLNFSMISYRFDSVSMCAGVFFSCLAFTVCQSICLHTFSAISFLMRLLIAALSIFLSLGTYQPTIGFYATASCIFLAHTTLCNFCWKYILKRSILSFLPLIIGSSFYVPIYLHAKQMADKPFYGLNEHPYVTMHNSLISFDRLFYKVFHNISGFFSYYYSYIGHNTASAIVIAIIAILLAIICCHPINLRRKITAFFFLVAALISCASIQIFLKSPVYATRTSVTLCAFVVGITFLTIAHSKLTMLKNATKYLQVLLIILSIGILSAIGNAQRDQFRFEQDIVYNGLDADLGYLYDKGGLKSFSITPWSLSTCVNTLSVLQDKYHFLREFGSMTTSMFTVSKILSYLPIEYNLSANFKPGTNLNELETVVEKFNYTIKRVSDGQYLVVLHPHQASPSKLGGLK